MTEEGRAVLGFNAVLGALESPGRILDRVFILRGRGGPRIRAVVQACRKAGVPLAEADRARLDRLSAGGRHQGVVGLAAAAAYTSLEELLESCLEGGRLVLLDGVQDPRNLGAVIRSAAAAGVRGVVIPEHRSAGLTPGALRAAAGAASVLAVARCRNIADLARDLGEQGFWVAGLEAGGEVSWDRVRYPPKMALVAGGESKGLRPRVRRYCQARVAIPLASGVESLNLSVAVAVVLYEALRQDRGRGQGGQ